ncbi:HemK2/MTQ2 family protein methyltransferase [Kineococcus rhizosphaerae]|uniref:Release factor glutamine methyltransferase n=1 Tax=Kineococcus rhizosphaerae TaxID=559628 RepID=A0A2T0R0E7_9ACTN|nr:HemK2/MTQ2 family protein methyltransferase [Kineococcus rhizosphaerae]PRY12538.1 release factor glutamine methyltransferase [Kineococcus rhizosphaerae]
MTTYLPPLPHDTLPPTRVRRPVLRLPGTYPAQGDTFLLARTAVGRDAVAGRDLLDVGTGGGTLAVTAARAGARSVTAVDISWRSVLTARLNGLVHRASLTVRHGDLFAPVAGRRFDVVLANPPYVPAATDRLPRHRPGRSWDAGRDGRAVIDRICDGIGDVLAPDGRLLMVHSVLAGEEATLDRLRDRGFEASVVARADEPFGPVMRARAQVLRERGLLGADQVHEELVVVEAFR